MLFEKLKIKNIELKNRIVMPAMNLGFSLDGSVNDRLINFYEARAKGGAGLIMVGGVAIQEQEVWGGFASIHDDRLLEGHKKMVSAIHRHSAKAGIQLFHAGRYSFAFTNGHEIKAPSPLASPLSGHQPIELSIGQIKEIIKDFGQAALRAKTAGYDVIEVIGSAGYLINQFYSPATNKRTDEYGGSLENRMKFGLEVIKEIRHQVGNDVVLSIRLGGSDFVEAGNSWREMSKFAQALEKASLDMINVTGGWHESRIPQIQAEVPRGAYSYLATKIKDAVSIPVVASNRINNIETAENILINHQADLISVCRGFLADPNWAIKAEKGQANTIRKCIACMTCLDMLFDFDSPTYGVGCAINAQAGFEAERIINKTDKPVDVLIIGAGPAGLEAARVAAIKGHRVTLVEKEDKIGGQWNIASIPPGKDEFNSLLYYYENVLPELDIKLLLNTAADIDLVKKLKPDKIIVATGARPTATPFSIDKDAQTMEAWDVLNGSRPQGSEIVVIGGGSTGCETALHIAEFGTLDADSLRFLLMHQVEDYETLYKMVTKGSHKVTLIEMDKYLARDMGRAMRWTVLKRLGIMGVNIMNETRVEKVTSEGVRVINEGQEMIIPADSVVLSVGTSAENKLYNELKQMFNDVKLIGDAQDPAKIIDAIHQAFDAANGI